MTARVAGLAVVVAGVAACGAPSGAAPAVDSALVEALADGHLADARAALDTTGRDQAAVADSLRRVALATHGLDSAALAARLDALASDPALAQATYDSLDARLALERRGVPRE